MYYIIWILLLVNLATVVYFVFTFERMFLIMKAGSLSELLKYKQELNSPKKEEEDDIPY